MPGECGANVCDGNLPADAVAHAALPGYRRYRQGGDAADGLPTDDAPPRHHCGAHR